VLALRTGYGQPAVRFFFKCDADKRMEEERHSRLCCRALRAVLR